MPQFDTDELGVPRCGTCHKNIYYAPDWKSTVEDYRSSPSYKNDPVFAVGTENIAAGEGWRHLRDGSDHDHAAHPHDGRSGSEEHERMTNALNRLTNWNLDDVMFNHITQQETDRDFKKIIDDNDMGNK